MIVKWWWYGDDGDDDMFNDNDENTEHFSTFLNTIVNIPCIKSLRHINNDDEKASHAF